MKKPKIIYPCEWNVRVIGASNKLILDAVDDTINDRPYEITPTNRSKTGKYVSFNVKLTLASEEEKDNLYSNLRSQKNIIFVL